MKDFVGEQHRRLLDTLAERLRQISEGSGDAPRIVVLEGPAGVGKSRLVREFYRVLRTEHDPEGYWPELDETGAGSTRSRDPLPGRKRTGPEATGFSWRPNTLPGFAWWQLQCERMQSGDVIDVVGHVRPEVEAHLVPLGLAWNRVASTKDKVRAAIDGVDLESKLRDALLKGGLEGANQLLKAIADFTIPGLGAAASWGQSGYRWVQKRRELKEAARSDVDLGAEVGQRRTSASHELADLIIGVAHRELPAVLIVEDIHLMSETVGELIDTLSSGGQTRPILIVAMAWPESRDAPIYARWREQALREGRAEMISMPELDEAELSQFVLAYAPKTASEVVAEAVRRFTNPLMMEAVMASSAVTRAIATNGGALPVQALEARPMNLGDVYRERFRELPDDVKTALALAAGTLPDPGQHEVWPGTGMHQVWPFIRTVVADAVERCTEVTEPRDTVLQALDGASQAGVWLTPSGEESESFREAFQGATAFEYLEEQLLPHARLALRASVTDVLSDWVDARRGDNYLVELSETAVIISRWLLELADAAYRPHTLAAAAHCVALVLAEGFYEYGRAADIIGPRLKTLRELDVHTVDHRQVLWMRNAEATWLQHAGRAGEAEFESLLTDCQRAWGADHPDTLTIHNNVGTWLLETGTVEQAITEYEALLGHSIRIHGHDHPETLMTRGNVEAAKGLEALMRKDRDAAEKAITALEALLRDQQRVMPDHIETLTTRYNLAMQRGYVGKTAEARRDLQALFFEYENRLGPEHPRTVQVKSSFGFWHSRNWRPATVTVGDHQLEIWHNDPAPPDTRTGLEEAAAHGDTDAMTNLGLMLAMDTDPPDIATARKWLEKAAAADNIQAMASLGILLVQNYDPPEPATALTWSEKAAAAGNTEAMYNLGRIYAYQLDVPDIPTAHKWWETAAADGHTNAMYTLGLSAYQADPPDLPTARKWWEMAAAAGHPDGMNALAAILINHQWDPPEPPKTARTWLEKAAAAGNTDAMTNLGIQLARHGQPKERRAGRVWLEKAAVAGDADAMLKLSMLLARNWNPPEPSTAHEWLEKAAAAGHPYAMNDLGVYLLNGDPPDVPGARGWWEKAAAAGNADAMHNLGVMFSRLMEPPDPATARRWYVKAAAGGHPQAMAKLESLEAHDDRPGASD